MCYVLLVIQLLGMNGFFPLCYGFFPVCHFVYTYSSLSDVWWYLQTPCVSADFFPVCCGFFPVIYSWAFVHQSSICRVVDVLCAVSYTVDEDYWIFPLCYRFFSVCHRLHRAVVHTMCHLLVFEVHHPNMIPQQN